MNYKGIYKILYFDKHVQEYTINMLTHSHKYKYNIHSSMSLLETHLEVREQDRQWVPDNDSSMLINLTLMSCF